MQLYRSKHQFSLLGMYLNNKIIKILDSFSSSSAVEWTKPYKTIDLLKEHNPNVSEHYPIFYPSKISIV